jgi:hypothetical protein
VTQPWVLVFDDIALEAVAHDLGIRHEVLKVAEDIASTARTTAPRSPVHRTPPSGHGADTIHAEPEFRDGEWEAKVGWDQLHAYMRFPERREHFLRLAAQTYTNEGAS